MYLGAVDTVFLANFAPDTDHHYQTAMALLDPPILQGLFDQGRLILKSKIAPTCIATRLSLFYLFTVPNFRT